MEASPFVTAATDLGNGQILILVALLVVPIAAIAFATVGSSLKTLGKGRFAIDQDLPPSRPMKAPVQLNRREQETEIRQMLEAKSYRREQRGESALDIDAETERLLNPPAPSGSGIDKELREEVRQLVIARNERRMRQGKPPLDVSEEIDRQLRDLENLGQ
jgi:hypothetical protein